MRQQRSSFAPLSLIASCVGLLLCGSTQAQSVNLYGKVNLGVRQVTNANPSGAHVSQLSGTQDGGAFLGIKVSEDLGGGNGVEVILESNINPDTGTQQSADFFWNRNSQIALKGSWGRLSMGRHIPMAGAVGPLLFADPMRGTSLNNEMVWLGSYTGLRYNNMLQYQGTFDGVYVGALYTPGEQTNGDAYGRSMGASLGYQKPGMTVRGAYQTTEDGTGKKAKIFSVGGNVGVGAGFTLHGAYIDGKYDAGFVASRTFGGALHGSAIGMLMPLAAEMDLKAYIAGVSWTAGPWTARLGLHEAKTKGATWVSAVAGKGDGNQRLVYLFGQYALSPRTSLQAGVDINKWSGKYGKFWGSDLSAGTGATLNGHDGRTTTQLGVSHSF
ncbi:porin [Roseateles sp. BYS180W]|uniref:Porin n=1 Tax=Roseateles rivi TaxID=3299028 RepID=A0ABW7FWZ6_9BURK